MSREHGNYRMRARLAVSPPMSVLDRIGDYACVRDGREFVVEWDAYGHKDMVLGAARDLWTNAGIEPVTLTMQQL